MEQQESGRLAGKAAVAAVAARTKRAAATFKGGVRKGNSSSTWRQRSASPSSGAATASDSNDDDNDDAANRFNDDAATVEMPWGSSWWDRMPAEIRTMILDLVSPLHQFLDGKLGTKEELDEATKLAIWADAFKRDWQGDLALLPDTPLMFQDSFSQVHTRSMYERLRLRCPYRQQLWELGVTKPSLLNAYVSNHFLGFNRLSLFYIPARRGWFDLFDYKYPIALGWWAIVHGHAALLRHLAFTRKVVDLSQFREFDLEPAMNHAAASGCLETLQMLHDAGNGSFTTEAMADAAKGGHLDVMQWLHAKWREGCTKRALANAATYGHLHALKWLVEHYPSMVDNDAVVAAAKGGHLDVLTFLLPRIPDFDARAAIEEAADEGHLEMIKWFHAHRPDAFTPRVFWMAVVHKYADIVQFLLDNRYSFDANTILEVKDPAVRKSMIDSLTLERARTLLEEAKTKEEGFKTIVKLLEAAVKRLEKAKAKADKEANPKRRKTSSK